MSGIEVEVRGGTPHAESAGSRQKSHATSAPCGSTGRMAAYVACQVTTGSRVCWYPAFASYNIFRVAYWPFRAVDGRIPYF